MPDSAYSPGNDELARQGKLPDWMKPGVPVPASAWGEALNGLRAAAAFSTTKPKPGQEISVWLLVENTSDREIRFSAHDVIQTAHPKIMDADGKEVPTKGSWYTGLSPIQHHKLKPGGRLTVAKKSLFFEEKNNVVNAGFGSNRAATEPGEYRVRYESILGNGYAKADWGGQLTTGETKVVVSTEPATVPTLSPLPDKRHSLRESRFVAGSKSLHDTGGCVPRPKRSEKSFYRDLTKRESFLRSGN